MEQVSIGTQASTLKDVFHQVEICHNLDSITGLGIHPGIANGMLITTADNARILEEALDGYNHDCSIIFWAGVGDCDDFEALSKSSGFLSSDPSPNSWCAVQAKSESIPSVIGLPQQLSERGSSIGKRTVKVSLRDGSFIELEIEAHQLVFQNDFGEKVTVSEGDDVTVDGINGKLLIGSALALESPPKKFFRLLSKVVTASIEEFGPVYGWSSLSQSNAYQENHDALKQLYLDPATEAFLKQLKDCSLNLQPKALGTVHTAAGAVTTRLYYSDICLDSEGCLAISPANGLSGMGLLRTERLFINHDEIDVLRIALLGEESVTQNVYQNSLAMLEVFLIKEYESLLRYNSGCTSVVRTLCMPNNKLFPPGYDLSQIEGVRGTQARETVEKFLRENEVFHGCRGLRMHVQRPDLAKLEIMALLKASDVILAHGGEVDLVILLSMVTFAEEIDFYIKLFDEVYSELKQYGYKLPKVRLATMIETSAVFHDLKKIVRCEGEHIRMEGVLFGGNDFTTATLNMNRHDSVKNIVPGYIEKGIIQKNPFISLHEVVAETIGLGIKIIRNLAPNNFLIGFGGEQAADGASVLMIQKHCYPYSLDYVSTSPDRIPDIISAVAGDDPELESEEYIEEVAV